MKAKSFRMSIDAPAGLDGPTNRGSNVLYEELTFQSQYIHPIQANDSAPLVFFHDMSESSGTRS